jgi:hypothetical protein
VPAHWHEREERATHGAPTHKGAVMAEVEDKEPEPLYCPNCQREVADPLVCGDCAAVICRQCGTPLEKVDELGIG